MKNKILRFSSRSVYNADFFKQEIDNLEYNEIINLLLNQVDSGRLRSWSVYMNDEQFEFKQFITDDKVIQMKWCAGNGLAFVDCFNTIIDQIRREEPKVVFIHDYTFLDFGKVQVLKKSFPNIIWITYWGIAIEPARINWSYLRLFHLVMAPGHELQDLFEQYGLKSCQMRFGIIQNENVDFDKFDDRSDRILFAGSVNLNLGNKGYGHYSRMQDLTFLASIKAPISIYSNQQRVDDLKWTNKKKWFTILKRRFWLSKLQYSKVLQPILKKPVFGEEYFELLQSHKILFNPQSWFVGNIRFVEAAYCGNVMLTNVTDKNKEWMNEIFGKGNYLGYRNHKELELIIDNLKNRHYNLTEMARKARFKLLEYYDYKVTFDEIKINLKELLNEF